jgi:hypothetical protein
VADKERVMRKIGSSLIAAVAFLTIVAACGSSSSSGKAEVKAGGDGETTTTAATGSTNGDGGESEAFKQLVANREKEPLKVTYKVTGAGGDSPALTIAQDGKGNFAYITGDTRIIKRAGEKPASCTGTGADAKCQELPVDPSASYTAIFNAAAGAITNASDNSPFTDVSDETIAGRDAKCVTVSVAGTSTTVCADKETGVLLKWAGSAGGQSGSFEATDVTEPPDSDFTLPATPETMPDISQYTLPNN